MMQAAMRATTTAASRTSQRAERAIKQSAMRKQRGNTSLVLGVAGKELSQHLAERCARVQLGEDS